MTSTTARAKRCHPGHFGGVRFTWARDSPDADSPGTWNQGPDSQREEGLCFKGPQITASSGNLKMFATLSKHSFLGGPNCPCGMQDLFPDPGSNPGHGSDGDES